MSAQAACSRSKRPAGCPRAVQAASGLTGSQRVSELADEADFLPTDRRADLKTIVARTEQAAAAYSSAMNG